MHVEDIGEAVRRKVKVHGNIEELLKVYLNERLPPISSTSGNLLTMGHNIIMIINNHVLYIDAATEKCDENVLDTYSEKLDKFTMYSGLNDVSSNLKYDGVVSSISLDRDQEIFAIACCHSKKIHVS